MSGMFFKDGKWYSCPEIPDGMCIEPKITSWELYKRGPNRRERRASEAKKRKGKR